MGELDIRNLVVGMIQTNCYLIKNRKTNELIIVDPGDWAEKIEQAVSLSGATPVGILLTHGHYDHMMAAKEVKEFYQIPIYASAAEKELLNDASLNTSAGWAAPCTLLADIWLDAQQEFLLGGISIHVIATPGHTKGSVCFYLEEEGLLLSGDTLFCESIGRTDLPTGSMRAIKESLHRLLNELPEDVSVYPGHGEATTIAHEKQYNPFA